MEQSIYLLKERDATIGDMRDLLEVAFPDELRAVVTRKHKPIPPELRGEMEEAEDSEAAEAEPKPAVAEAKADAAANSMIGLLRAENEQHQEHIEELESRIEDQQSRIDELEESAAGAPVGGEPDGLGLAGAVIENLETENNQLQEHIHELETELRSRDASPRPASMADEDALATVMIENLAQENQQLHKQLDILHRESESMGSATGGAVDDTAAVMIDNLEAENAQLQGRLDWLEREPVYVPRSGSVSPRYIGDGGEGLPTAMTELQERINALEDTEEQLEIARSQDAGGPCHDRQPRVRESATANYGRQAGVGQP